MLKTTEMKQPLCILSPFFFCLFSGSILSLSFSFFLFFFLFLFFYVIEGEKQGSGVDSVCGVIKREMVAAR
jgi:sugar phosphate permease